MKTEWDYTELAEAYLKRPNYSNVAINAMLSIAEVKKGGYVCDIGAGVAHLTLMLAERGLTVTAIEPNDAMRMNGIKRTSFFESVTWHEGTGEETGQKSSKFDMVTFGSSFNVCDRPVTLKETARILKPEGWFACMWNHRNLNDPHQKEIERIILEEVPNYSYGTRREDQTSIISASELFNPVLHIDSEIMHSQTKSEVIEAWYSHATLKRQAAEKFKLIIEKIDDYLTNLKIDSIQIPYSTNIWMAQLKSDQ